MVVCNILGQRSHVGGHISARGRRFEFYIALKSTKLRPATMATEGKNERPQKTEHEDRKIRKVTQVDEV